MTKDDYISSEVWNSLAYNEHVAFLNFCEFIGITPKIKTIIGDYFIPTDYVVTVVGRSLYTCHQGFISTHALLSKEEVLNMVRLGSFNENA